MTNGIATQEVLFTVSTPRTGFTVSVTNCNLDSDLTIKDFVVYNNTTQSAISTTLWNKTSRTVLTYVGPLITAGNVLRIGRSTLLDRIQRTIQLGSTLSSSILDAEILRLYKLIAEKLAGFVVTNPVNNVTRRVYEPNVAPTALGDEWHQYNAAGSGSGEDTIRVWVATDPTGSNDELGWFEVTGSDGTNGTNGTAATISVGTVTTGAPGSSVIFTNAGSSTAAVFNVTIPRGDPGVGTTVLPITYAASVNLDMNVLNGLVGTISLTGNITFTTSNRAISRSTALRLVSDGTQRTLTFPAGWVFVGGATPSHIDASKTGMLRILYFGSADTDAVVTWDQQS